MVKCPNCNKKMERLECNIGLGSNNITWLGKIKIMYLCEDCEIIKQKGYKVI